MLSHIKHWLSISEKEKPEPLPAAKSIQLENKAGKTKSLTGNVPLDGIEAFLSANGVAPRDVVLSKHPFWQRPEPMLDVGAATYLKILEHILDISEQYMMALRYGSPASGFDHDTLEDEDEDEESRIRSMKGIIWGMPQEYMKWQNQAVVLAQQEPAHAAALLDIVRQQVLFNASEDNKNWPAQAEHLLENGGTFTVAHAMAGLQKSVACENLGGLLTETPNLAKLLLDPRQDNEVLAWATLHERNRHWLVARHPRLSAWDIADKLRDPKAVGALAEFTADGAVLKAWYGAPLTGDEIACHPLAYSLYVHKHAPIYMEEAQPLPETWTVALALCTAGIDFKNMLLMAAKAKVSPQSYDDSIVLPDLGPMP